MKKLLLALVLMAILAISGCGAPATTTPVTTTPTPSPTFTTPVTTPEGNELLVKGNTDFALSLYQALKDGDPNFFYSPYSISSALAMTYAGAEGETARQMAETLKFYLQDDNLHEGFQWLRAEIEQRAKTVKSNELEGQPFELHTVNDIWGQEGFGFLEEFLTLVDTYYGAGLRELNFEGEADASRVIINDYIAEQTNERIKDLLPGGSITPLTRLVLTNAIYFNANWLFTFPENLTAPADFHHIDGSTSTVDMMRQETSFVYGTGDGWQAIQLPYMGQETAMLMLLPDEDEFTEFESALDADMLDGIIDELERQHVNLFMPKFEFETSLGLKDTLAALGMPMAFSGDADFSGMTGAPELFISDVVHKAFISVDEKGTEAAAATGVIMPGSAPLEPVTMTIDSPFIFLIRDTVNGTVYFMGRVQEP